VPVGLGRDEFNGQAADLRVVMADLIAQCRFLEFAKQLKAWSLLMRRPWIHVLLQTIVQLLPVSLRLRLSTGSRLDPGLTQALESKSGCRSVGRPNMKGQDCGCQASATGQ